MNLQICVPHEPCPFKCPMCIARGRKIFSNLYKQDEYKYFNALEKAMGTTQFEYYILTGSADPTLNKEWMESVFYFLDVTGERVELQTRNYNLANYELDTLDTLAYSVYRLRDYLKSWKFRKIKKNNRLVILLTDEFKILNVNDFDTMGYNQITFKVLQTPVDRNAQEWIIEHQLKDLSGIYGIVDHYNGSDVSVRLDANCQDSHGRYMIFREDGKLYKAWEDEN